MKKGVLSVVIIPLVGLAGLLMIGPAAVSGIVSSAGAGAVSPSGASLVAIPAAVLGLYGRAATACPGLSWTVLAGIGKVESDHGQSNLAGVHSGANAAGAEGPMQFLPATFAGYDRPVPPGGADPPSPYDFTDAAFAAARMLCANGATRPGGLGPALYDYNHSESYVAAVLTAATEYGLAATSPPARVEAALEYALGQVGTPYRWGGETPGVGFDCSGLVQAAWSAAGVELPRVAQDQFDAGPLVGSSDALASGDLVFFGPSTGDVTHVGMVIDPSGVMIDAPHTGADVRLEEFPVAVGDRWGGDLYLGATRPANLPG